MPSKQDLIDEKKQLRRIVRTYLKARDERREFITYVPVSEFDIENLTGEECAVVLCVFKSCEERAPGSNSEYSVDPAQPFLARDECQARKYDQKRLSKDWERMSTHDTDPEGCSAIRELHKRIKQHEDKYNGMSEDPVMELRSIGEWQQWMTHFRDKKLPQVYRKGREYLAEQIALDPSPDVIPHKPTEAEIAEWAKNLSKQLTGQAPSFRFLAANRSTTFEEFREAENPATERPLTKSEHNDSIRSMLGKLSLELSELTNDECYISMSITNGTIDLTIPARVTE